MKKKHLLIGLLSVTMALSAGAFAAGCNNDDNPPDGPGIVQPEGKVTVTFDSDGGTAVLSQSIDKGGKAVLPAPAPTKTGYTFDGWYKDGETTPFDFNTEINENVTLKAHWKAVTTVTEYKTPVINVNPATLSFYTDDDENEIDLSFGVTIDCDEGDDVEWYVSDDDDFDLTTAGTYTITYSATSKISGKEATATRTVIVEQALAQLTLEVRENKFANASQPDKWQGVFINFRHSLYSEISSDTNVTRKSGVWHNTGSEEVVLSVEGSYGVAAILTANGVVIEGRDGANGDGKLVNADNPVRANSTVSTLTVDGEEKLIREAFAKDLHIPAGGYAVIIQNQFAGEKYDNDGRGFAVYSIIHEYGNVVRLFWADHEDDVYLTPYADQGPTVSGNANAVFVAPGSTFDKNTLKNGLTLVDDGGVFGGKETLAAADHVEVLDNEDFDIETPGDYTFRLVAKDNNDNETHFTRLVKVVSEDEITTVSVADNATSTGTIKVLNSAVAIDQDLTSAGSYAFIVYTYGYKQEHETLDYTNTHGGAYIVSIYGKILRTYDGGNGQFRNEENEVSSLTPSQYIEKAYESLSEGEILFIAPNSTANSAEGGSRWMLLKLENRSKIGSAFTFTGIDFIEKPYTFTVGEGEGAKSFTAVESKYSFNEARTAQDAPSYGMIVYTTDYKESLSINGNGVAVVLDRYGKIAKIYDGANGGYYEETTDKKALPDGCTTANYATYALENLLRGETLVIFPYDPNGAYNETANAARSFGLSLRSLVGEATTLTDIKFLAEGENPDETLVKIGETEYTSAIDLSKIAINKDVQLSEVGNYDAFIFTTTFNGKLFANSYGTAYVINEGKIVRIYDGAEGKYYDAENTNGAADIVTNANYLSVAINSLQAKEYLFVGANNGSADLSPVRQFLRNNINGAIGKDFELTNCDVPVGTKAIGYLTVNGATYYTQDIAVNKEVQNAQVSSYDAAVYTYGYNGIVVTNGFAEIVVFDSEGKVVKFYDVYQDQYFTVENPEGVTRTDEMFAKANTSIHFFETLQPGETLVIGLNGGAHGGAVRSWLSGKRLNSIGTDVVLGAGLGVPAAETSEITYMTVTVNGKTYYQNRAKVAIDEAYTGNPEFGIFTYEYKNGGGTCSVTNGWGVALIVDVATGKVVKIFDGTTGTYTGPDNEDGSKPACTSGGYASEAFNAIEEGQYLIIGVNVGGANASRSFINSGKSVGTSVSYSVPQTPEETETPENQD